MSLTTGLSVWEQVEVDIPQKKGTLNSRFFSNCDKGATVNGFHRVNVFIAVFVTVFGTDIDQPHLLP
jgi:hypothetical protein